MSARLFGPNGLAAVLSTFVTLVLVAISLWPAIAFLRGSAGASVLVPAALALLLTVASLRPWVVVSAERVWRHPLFGRPLARGDISELRAREGRVEASYRGAWTPVCVVPFAAYGVDDHDAVVRLQQLIDM